MYHKKKVSLVFPAFNEEENITSAIKDFKSLRIIDEILVVDNNSTDKTSLFAKKAGAKVVIEKKQGYGFALRKGLESSKGDLIVLCEPDGTFISTDLKRLLAKSDKFDMVMGSRTNLKYVNKNANMGTFLRFGNITLAKLIQFLHKTPSISDCGCTYRVMNKNLVSELLPRFTVGSSHLLPEIIILANYLDFSITEIPVRYKKRIGESKITGSIDRALLVGFKMLGLVIGYKLVLGKK